MIVDTSALLAFFDIAEPRHADVVREIEATAESLVVSPYVIAELDYLVLTRHGSQAELAVLAELASGAWELASMDAGRFEAARRVVERYRDRPIGLADASNIVLADVYRTRTIATLDVRHFSVLRLQDGGSPLLVP
ncbi:MAG: PIN domain-containing protein [Protaetiibacter sp.]